MLWRLPVSESHAPVLLDLFYQALHSRLRIPMDRVDIPMDSATSEHGKVTDTDRPAGYIVYASL